MLYVFCMYMCIWCFWYMVLMECFRAFKLLLCYLQLVFFQPNPACCLAGGLLPNYAGLEKTLALMLLLATICRVVMVRVS